MINLKFKNTKIPLVLSACTAIILIVASLIFVPTPFNYIMALAICGPLSACILGLKPKSDKQREIKI